MPVTSPEGAVRHLRPLLCFDREAERLAVLCLGKRGGVIAKRVLTVGNDGFTIVCPKQILRYALTRERPVSAIVLAHNHPSNNPEPSHQDVSCTERVAAACKVVGLHLLDHVVVCDDSHTSLAALGHIATGASPMLLAYDAGGA
jgi:DNA repair protein RadC